GVGSRTVVWGGRSNGVVVHVLDQSAVADHLSDRLGNVRQKHRLDQRKDEMREFGDARADENKASNESGERNTPIDAERGERIDDRTNESEDQQKATFGP